VSSEQDPFESARTELVLANHILARHGVVDGWGHVSVRKPGAPDRFILARSLAPALVTEDDLLELDVATADAATWNGTSTPGSTGRGPTSPRSCTATHPT